MIPKITPDNGMISYIYDSMGTCAIPKMPIKPKEVIVKALVEVRE